MGIFDSVKLNATQVTVPRGLASVDQVGGLVRAFDNINKQQLLEQEQARQAEQDAWTQKVRAHQEQQWAQANQLVKDEADYLKLIGGESKVLSEGDPLVTKLNDESNYVSKDTKALLDKMVKDPTYKPTTEEQALYDTHFNKMAELGNVLTEGLSQTRVESLGEKLLRLSKETPSNQVLQKKALEYSLQKEASDLKNKTDLQSKKIDLTTELIKNSNKKSSSSSGDGTSSDTYKNPMGTAKGSLSDVYDVLGIKDDKSTEANKVKKAISPYLNKLTANEIASTIGALDIYTPGKKRTFWFDKDPEVASNAESIITSALGKVVKEKEAAIGTSSSNASQVYTTGIAAVDKLLEEQYGDKKSKKILGQNILDELTALKLGAAVVPPVVTTPVVEKPTTVTEKEKKETPVVKKKVDVFAKQEEETTKRYDDKLAKVNKQLSEDSKTNAMTPWERTLMKLGMHPKQREIEKNRSIQESKDKFLQKRIELAEEQKAKEQEKALTPAFTAFNKKEARKRGYIGTGTMPFSYKEFLETDEGKKAVEEYNKTKEEKIDKSTGARTQETIDRQQKIVNSLPLDVLEKFAVGYSNMTPKQQKSYGSLEDYLQYRAELFNYNQNNKSPVKDLAGTYKFADNY